MSSTSLTISQTIVNALILCRTMFSLIPKKSYLREFEKKIKDEPESECIIAFNNVYIKFRSLSDILNVSSSSVDESSIQTSASAGTCQICYVEDVFGNAEEEENLSIVKLVNCLGEETLKRFIDNYLIAIFDDSTVIADVDYISKTIDYYRVDVPFFHINIDVPVDTDINKEKEMIIHSLDEYVKSYSI